MTLTVAGTAFAGTIAPAQHGSRTSNATPPPTPGAARTSRSPDADVLQPSLVSRRRVLGVRPLRAWPWAAALACLPALALTACGGDSTPAKAPTATQPTPTTRTQLTRPSVVKADAQPPKGLAAGARRAFIAGRTVVEDNGCLACHRIGNSGLSGVGPDLSAIGATLPRTAIRRSLLNPTAPMPSYRKLPKRDLDAVVSFLVRLLPDVNGGLRCVAGSDCG